MAPVEDTELDDLIEDVIQASKLPARKRGTSIKPTVDKLTSAFFDQGLEPERLNKVLDLICTPSHLDQASLNALVNNLYPAINAPSEAILKVIGSLGHGERKPSYSIQAGLLRWLVMVYHIIEDPDILSQAYAVLFNLIETAAIRPQLCHVLALITRRKHVRPFRIQLLLHLTRANDPPLVGLLRIFKDYYPEIIVAEAVRGKASAFKHPDLAWREQLNDIQRAHAQKTSDVVSRPLNGFSVNKEASGRGRATRPSGLPSVHTSHANETDVTLEEVKNAERFVKNLEKIQLPNQLAAVLADPLLQKLLSLRKDDATSRRVKNWIESTLVDVLEGNTDTKGFEDVMEVLRDYVTRVKDVPHVVLNFFAKLFETWNGSVARNPILGTLSFTGLTDFKDLEQHLFRPLEKCLPSTPDAQISLVRMYRDLLHHWTGLLKSWEAIPSDVPVESVRGLQRHVNTLVLTMVQAYPSLDMHASILEFYEQAAATTSDSQLEPSLRIAHPPLHLMYLIFFSPSLGNMARLSGALALFKTAFDRAMARSRSTYSATDLRPFNSFLMDICNCLWRGRGFNATDNNALACMASRATIASYHRYLQDLGEDLAANDIFGLSYGPTLSMRSIQYVRAMEDEADATALAQGKLGLSKRHAGPVTQGSLKRLRDDRGLQLTWAEYRVQVLHGLEEDGFGGVGALMKNVMKVLQKAPVPSQASQSSMASA